MKMNNMKSLPDLILNDGSKAFHVTFETNQGTLTHRIYWPAKLRKAEIELTESEFETWKLENVKG